MLQKLADRLVALAPPRYRNGAREFIKFGITGTIGAIVDFGTYNVITRGFGWVAFYTVFGQPFLYANNISVLLAIISNFILNKYWTFRDTSKEVGKQWLGFFVFNFFTWILNQMLVSFFIFQVPLLEAMFGTQNDNVAKVLAVGIILFLNFFGSKFLIFNRDPKPIIRPSGPTTPLYK